MILYKLDWLLYPSAIVDFKTTNTSWLRQCEVYRRMGIENCAFPLALIQPELQGVDPHSPSLTLTQKIMIGMECRENPWYFFREVVRVPAQGGSGPGKLKANRGNLALYWLFFNSIDAGLVQPRQTGKSLSVDCLMDGLLYVFSMNTKISMMTKDDDLRKANVDRLKGIRDLLPKYLINVTSKDADNKNELSCLAKNNRYITGVSQNSESAANNLGRGQTTPILHCDEGPFINFIGVTLPAALAAGTAARLEAAEAGNPNGNIFTTTAGKKDDRDGAYIYEMFHDAAIWTEAYFDAKDKKDLVQLIVDNKSGRKIMVNITMSHRQLGYTDEWLYDAISVANAKGEAADRDFFNVWTSGSRRSPLTVKLNEAIRESIREVLYTQRSEYGFFLRWYIPREEIEERMNDGHYVIGLDTSEAVGRDAIALVITDIRDLSTVAVGTYNESSLIRFSAYLADLLVKFTNTTLVIERKSTGQMIIDDLLIRLPAAGVDPFKRIYSSIVDKYQENPDEYQLILRNSSYRNEAFYVGRKNTFGLSTSSKSRDLIYTIVLQNAAKQACHLIRDATLISEINGLVEKGGRIDHASSGHDDHVMAWLLTHWFLSHTKNLEHYGIDRHLLMSEVDDLGDESSQELLQKKREQDVVMDQIDEILDEIKHSNDEFMIAKLENKLKAVSMRLSESDIQALSLDELVHSATEERLKRQRMGGTVNRGLERNVSYALQNRPMQQRAIGDFNARSKYWGG
jgi:hypothetical protein